jgi:hypothetical protein
MIAGGGERPPLYNPRHLIDLRARIIGWFGRYLK